MDLGSSIPERFSRPPGEPPPVSAAKTTVVVWSIDLVRDKLPAENPIPGMIEEVRTRITGISGNRKSHIHGVVTDFMDAHGLWGFPLYEALFDRVLRGLDSGTEDSQ